MSQNIAKQLTHSRSLEHSNHLARLSLWLKHLPGEERYLQVRLNNPVIVGWLKNRYCVSKEEDPKQKDSHDLCSKELRHSVKALFQNLIVTSQNAYMDTVGFEVSLLDDVDRFLELLSSLAFRCKSAFEFGQLPINQSELPVSCTREKLAFLLAKFLLAAIRYRYQHCEASKTDLQKEKLRKRQYGAYWSTLSPEEKQNFLFLGAKDAEQLHQLLGLDLSVKDLEKEMAWLLKLEKNQFCNKLLKCKFRRCNDLIRLYHKRIFETIHEKLGQRERNLKRRIKKRVSKSFSSNDTNETDGEIIDGLIQKITQLANFKLQADLTDFVYILSQKANVHFTHRQIAFKRMQHVLQPYGVALYLFGSCANGIAIEKSDVDIAVSGNILNYFPYGTIKVRTGIAIESMHALLASKSWVVSAKPITTAAVPVLKLEINTSKPMEENLPPSYLAELELPKADLPDVIIDVDLSVDTRGYVQPEHCHLGIPSTELIGQWLGETESLYSILLVLKHILWRKNLSNTYKGGISTYCLVVMIKVYIKWAGLKDPHPAALLQGFLKFIGNEFDERKYGMDFEGKQSPFYQRQEDEYRIEVKDPISGRVMTKNTFMYTKIKEEFSEMKVRCMDGLRHKIRHHLKNLSLSELQEIKGFPPEKYFAAHAQYFPKNVFCEYDSSF